MEPLKASRSIVLGTSLMMAALSGSAATGTGHIGVEERANSYASLAASGQLAVLVWGASTKNDVTDVYVATSHDGGRAFGAPTRVNHVAGDARFSGEQPPRIALVPRAGRSPSIVVVWTAKAAAGTRLLSARSDDGGKSFGLPVRVPGSEASGNRGWEAVATSREGDVVAVWLDHRELSTSRGASSMSHEAHQHLASASKQTDGVARAQLSKLMFASLGQAASSRALTGGVCYCCKTAIATDSAGGVYAAWRHVYEGNVRDLAFTRSSDGGRTFAPPVRVSHDNWVLDGCPENGPAMIVDDAARVHVVWPTLVRGPTSTSEPTLALFYAMSQDGRRFTARQRIPTVGVPRHPQVARGRNGELIVAWDEQANGTRRIALARGTIDATGTARFARQPIGDLTRAEYPTLATTSDGTIVAWTSGSPGQTVIRAERLAN